MYVHIGFFKKEERKVSSLSHIIKEKKIKDYESSYAQ
jgi:hypothetical protein